MSRLRGFASVSLLLCLVCFGAGCGGDDGATQEQLDAARAEGAKEARDQAKVEQLQQQVEQLQKQTGSGSSDSQEPSDSTAGSAALTSCGDGIQVGPGTSCSFAMNVAGEKGSNPDSSVISTYSPVTGEKYTMTCVPWSGGGTVCTGGKGATVYLP